MKERQTPLIIPVFIPHGGCPHRCVFCNQREITGHGAWATPRRILATVHSYRQGEQRLRELAFYGGSFTCLPINLQEAYLKEAATAREAGVVQSIRLSTRPDGISPNSVQRLKRYGVETVELGVQSMDDEVLRLSRRGHTALQSHEAIELLQSYGFKVGVQLMPGLPGADPGSDMLTANKVIELRPAMVRIYPTVVVRGTALSEMYLRGEYQPMRLEEIIPLCALMLLSFKIAHIPVIRLGLQHTAALGSGAIVAGPHHPALRHLVESHLHRSMAVRGLQSLDAKGGEAIFILSPRNQANLRGQKNSNLLFLKRTFSLRSLEVKARAGMGDDEVALLWEGKKWMGRLTDLQYERLALSTPPL